MTFPPPWLIRLPSSPEDAAEALPEPFSHASILLDGVARLFTSYPTPDQMRLTPPDEGSAPSVRIFARALRRARYAHTTRPMIPRTIPPRTARPAMTPGSRPAAIVLAPTIPSAWSITYCWTHSPWEHDDSSRPVLPNRACKKLCWKVQRPSPGQAMVRGPVKVLIAPVRFCDVD
jgi:hypothetical protein